MPWDHINYFEGLEVFVNNSEDSLRKMTFNCMDHNSDGYISEIDLWMLMRTLNSDIFVTVVSKDVITLVNLLHAKKIERGIADPIENRMKKLMKKSIDLKNKVYKKSLGLNSSQSEKDTPKPSTIFELSTLNKIADVLERRETINLNGNKGVDLSSSKKDKSKESPKENIEDENEMDEQNHEHVEPHSKVKHFLSGSNVTSIIHQLSEQEEETEKLNLDQYLKHSKKGIFPALLIDIFRYLGAKKYVEHVLDPRIVKIQAKAPILSKLTLKPSVESEMVKYIKYEMSKNIQAYGEIKVNEFYKSFQRIAVDPTLPPIEIYATLDSIKANFGSIFGVENEFLAKQLYNY